MSTVVFAGPSIFGADPEVSPDLTILPPAACGDILNAVRSGAQAIGLVDGVFGAARSVWHKEILLALSRGIRVLGASSMGALRAAECGPFGMEGVGQIYADYRDGVRSDDGDVALLHGPAELGWRPLTVALVDADSTIISLFANRVIREDEVSALGTAARSLHFARRSWPAVLCEARVPQDRRASILACLDRFRVEQKKSDALALFARLSSGTTPAAASEERNWQLSRTTFLAALEGAHR